MGILRRLAGLGSKVPEVKAGNVPVDIAIPLSSSKNYLPRNLPIDFPSITKWAYRGNELVHSCMDERGRALREAPLRIFNEHNDKWEEGHEVEALMANPNPFRSQPEFIESIEQHLLLTGNAFIHKVRDRSGRVAQLWLKKPHLIKIIPHPIKYISAYIYTVDGQEYRIDPEDIIHIMYIDPDNDYYGIAPIVAAAKRVDADSELAQFTKRILLNMAVTSGVFSTEKKLNPDERQILEDKMINRYAGAIRAGLPMVLSHGMKWETTSMNMKELEVGNLAAILESRICLAFHVPAVVVGAKVGLDKSTFTNVREAREYMYENTIAPEWQMIANKLGAALLLDFGYDLTSGLVARFDTRQIKALQESEDMLWKRVNSAEPLSMIEKRIKLGYPKDPDGIVFLDANRVAVDITTGELVVKPEPVPIVVADPDDPNGEDPTKPNKELKPGEEKQPEPKPGEEKKNKPETKDRLVTLPTEAQRQQLLDSIVAVEDTHYELLMRGMGLAFDDIATEIETFLNTGGIKTLDVKDYRSVFPDLEEKIRKHIDKNMRTNIELVHVDAAERTRKILGYSFGLPNEEAVKFAKTHTAKLSGDIAKASIQTVRDTISNGLAAGVPLPKIKDTLMREVNGWSAARAETVARTETLRAANMGSLATMKQAGIGYKQFLAAPDACHICKALSEQVNTIDEDFIPDGASVSVPGATSISTNGFGAMATPPLHPRCVIGDTEIIAPDAENVIRSYYSGEIVKLSLADGRTLAVTPNHILLTTQGWKAAKFITKFDSVINSPLDNRVVNPNKNNTPARAEDIFSTLGMAFGVSSMRVPVTAKDLKGDSRFGNGNIDVIYTKGFLRNTVQSLVNKGIKKKLLGSIKSSFSFDSKRSIDKELVALSLSSSSNISVKRISDIFFGRTSIHHKSVSLNLITSYDSRLKEASGNYGPTNPQRFSKGIFRFPGKISSTKVVNVKVKFFHGYVYDLSTFSTLYSANGILSSNCRCTIAGIPSDLVTDKDYVIDKKGSFEDARNWLAKELPEDELYEFRYGISEALQNVFRHGSGKGSIKIRQLAQTGGPTGKKTLYNVTVRDKVVNGFVPKPSNWVLPDFTATHGRGFGIMARSADRVTFTRYAKGNKMVFSKSVDVYPKTYYHFLDRSMQPSNVQAVTKAFDDLNAKYPSVARTLDRVQEGNLDTTTIAETWWTSGASTSSIEDLATNKRRAVISFDIKKMSDPKFGTRLDWEADTGFHSVGGIYGTSSHEYGHVVDGYLQDKGWSTKLPQFTKEQRENTIVEKVIDPEKYRGEVSIYALKNEQEQFAEVFSLFNAGTAPNHPQVKAMEELLRKAGIIK